MYCFLKVLCAQQHGRTDASAKVLSEMNVGMTTPVIKILS